VRLADLLAPLAPPLCAACGAAAGRSEPLCGACRRALRWLGPEPVEVAGLRVWAPVAYDGPARDLVRALKFHGAWRAAETMAAQITANAPAALLGVGTPPGEAPPPGEPPALVPVPLHPRRLRRRGYDQAGLLARALAERTGLALAECLERRGSAGAQVGRGRAERLAGPPGEVGVRPGTGVPRRALLVDDVVTTGGTLSACAAALRTAGTEGVAAVAYARTPGR
jgi:predicted amidophosphoribosyltransferase